MQAAYPYIWYFFIYAFLGWGAEVIFAAARKGVFVNRGFLNGPLCPIYGVGLVAVVALLAPVRDSLGLLYLGAVLLTSAIELVTGFLMEKLFHQRWWDYSQMPFNIGGYVCLLFSLIWGLACLLIVDVVHPLVAGLVARIPQKLGWPLLAAFLVIMAADYAVTIACVLKLNRRLSGLDDAAKRLRTVSDSLGEGLADGAIALRKRNEALRTVLRERQEKGNFVERRLIHAFPQMRSLKPGRRWRRLKSISASLKSRIRRRKRSKNSVIAQGARKSSFSASSQPEQNRPHPRAQKARGYFLLRRMASTVEQTSRQRRKPGKTRRRNRSCFTNPMSVPPPSTV